MGPKDDEHPLLVAAKKELLGTDDTTTLEQVCVKLRLYSQRPHLLLLMTEIKMYELLIAIIWLTICKPWH